ncbi:hypothetical protein [Methyloterricola oryzae]|uniref:hypothetical protein n=1 Tax=Methyloterricola oryzae TaxID=1495050 RepID=UPI0005EB3C7F|nr:hypothetical protein [Methyloterricola oryzae]
MKLKERFLAVFQASQLSYRDLELRTGIDRYRWQNLINKENQKVTEEHLEAIATVWPEYKYWIVFGETCPEMGQVSPELEEVRKKLG